MSERISVVRGSKKYVHIRGATKVLKVSDADIRLACSKSKLVCIQLGGAWYIAEDSLEAYKREKITLKQKRGATVKQERLEERMTIARKVANARKVVGGEIRKRKALL